MECELVRKRRKKHFSVAASRVATFEEEASVESLGILQSLAQSLHNS
jgi:hypothetical protein